MSVVLLDDRRSCTAPANGSQPTAIAAEPQVSYGHWQPAWDEFPARLTRLIEQHGIRSICDVGGGANPAPSPSQVAERQLEYTLLDVDERELAKAPEGYDKLPADICASPLRLTRQFDLVVSRMLLEHVADGERFHRNVLRMLRPGGLAVHFFPTLYALPFAVNRLLGEAWSARLLATFAPRDPVRTPKFPARYSWCRGPGRRQIDRLQQLGFEVLAYRGLFGHNYYARIPVARSLERLASRLLVRCPLPQLTSYAQLVLRKPMA